MGADGDVSTILQEREERAKRDPSADRLMRAEMIRAGIIRERHMPDRPFLPLDDVGRLAAAVSIAKKTGDAALFNQGDDIDDGARSRGMRHTPKGRER